MTYDISHKLHGVLRDVSLRRFGVFQANQHGPVIIPADFESPSLRRTNMTGTLLGNTAHRTPTPYFISNSQF